MSQDNTNFSLDLLGTKPIADAANTTVTKTFEGVEGFLKSVCMPALDEVGLLLKDKVRYWRLNNILRVIEKTKGKLNFENEQLQIKANPRVVLSIIENCSLNDNDLVQEMWAGLFASSCSKSGEEDENLIFVDLLKQLTVAEAKILKYSCENAVKVIHENGLISSDQLIIDSNTLYDISGLSEIHRQDRELDHLRSLGLLVSGFLPNTKDLIAYITPTALGFCLYVRCQGFNSDPKLYWENNVMTIVEKGL